MMIPTASPKRAFSRSLVGVPFAPGLAFSAVAACKPCPASGKSQWPNPSISAGHLESFDVVPTIARAHHP